MTLQETVEALYRIWRAPGKREYKFVLYRGSEAIAQFKDEKAAKRCVKVLAEDHLVDLYSQIQRKSQ